MRNHSYSYSPSPPRGYGKRYMSSVSRDHYGRHGADVPTSLLVRNLHLDCRVEDLREHFAQFGPLKDIYLPRDYYSGEPRGFGFVQYAYPEDAAEAKYQMDGKSILGRELKVVFAEENRKKPSEMRARERRRFRGYDRHRSPYYSRSPSRDRYASRSPGYYSPERRSISPAPRRHRARSYSRSPYYSRSRSRSLNHYSSRGRGYGRARSPSYYSRSPSPYYSHPQRSVSSGHRRGRARSYYSRSPSSHLSRSHSPDNY